jgi:hypothetical protein
MNLCNGFAVAVNDRHFESLKKNKERGLQPEIGGAVRLRE